MHFFQFVLIIVIGVLCYIQHKIKGNSVPNRFFLNYLCTITFLLFIMSFFTHSFHPVITITFDVFMVFYVVFHTLKYINQLKEQIPIMGDSFYFYFSIFVWSAYGICAILDIANANLPI